MLNIIAYIELASIWNGYYFYLSHLSMCEYNFPFKFADTCKHMDMGGEEEQGGRGGG